MKLASLGVAHEQEASKLRSYATDCIERAVKMEHAADISALSAPPEKSVNQKLPQHQQQQSKSEAPDGERQEKA